MTQEISWPYPLRWNKKRKVSADVLVLGGGIAGCWAAISAAKKGVKVALVEKGATIRSGAGGSGCDHWESAATNPCSKVTPEELTLAQIEDHGGYNNGISHYIECREGYDRLLDLEKMGAKIRDTEDEFKGAEFRDKETKFLFAYDYTNKFTLRVWGTTFKPALYKECNRLGVKIYDRVMATSLLFENGNLDSRIAGATGIHARTGEYFVFQAKVTVLAMSRPSRIWLFSQEMPGISEFRPPQCTGDGHAMAWKAGVEFTMMEKSVKAEWSGTRSFPPYGTGNNHNTWYACSMVDAEGREIPWVNRDGTILQTVSQRYHPASGQKFFLKGGGESEFPLYKYRGPDTLPVEELLKKGYKLPFYADLTSMPELERKAIWGLMVGQEGKTKIPILKNYSDAGFDPKKHLLQSYGDGWKSGAFLPQERQLFGIPGGIFNDWNLKTNLKGLYAAGDQLFASNCFGHAAATGFYAGRHAAADAIYVSKPVLDAQQVSKEHSRLLFPIRKTKGFSWKEMNVAISKIMQIHCGAEKNRELLEFGLQMLNNLKKHSVPKLKASNPHELVRAQEVINILTNAEIVILSSLARKASSKHLHFLRTDYPDMDPADWHKFILIKQKDADIQIEKKSIDYYGSLEENYRAHNKDVLEGRDK